MDKVKPGPHKCEVTTTTQARKQNYVCENDISWAILQPWPLDLDLQSRDVWFFLCDECTDIMFPGIIKHPHVPYSILLKNYGLEEKYFGNVSKTVPSSYYTGPEESIRYYSLSPNYPEKRLECTDLVTESRLFIMLQKPTQDKILPTSFFRMHTCNQGFIARA